MAASTVESLPMYLVGLPQVEYDLAVARHRIGGSLTLFIPDLAGGDAIGCEQLRDPGVLVTVVAQQLVEFELPQCGITQLPLVLNCLPLREHFG